jgi:hypothetical protein
MDGWMEEEEEAHLRLHGYSSSPMVSLGGSFEISPPGVGLAGFLGKASERGSFLGGVLVLGRVVIQSKLYPRFLELAGVFQFTHCSNNAFLEISFLFALRIDAQFAAQCLLV